ncbi:SurA N-terminal domain-containing protein [Candidatus Daviesbacteria bacterium]|nr:SurA N-terminal domain-containing protein [Candidatus Daviesbacteria bacterium]
MADRKGAKKTTRRAKGTKAEEVAKSELTSPKDQSRVFPKLLVPRNLFFLLIFAGIVLLLYFGSKFMVVAWVDKQPITRIEYYQAMERRIGDDMKEKLITDKLLYSEARKKNINVTDKEIQDQIKKIEDESGGAANVDQILSLRGISRQELPELVKQQIIKERIFGPEVKVTDEEVDKYIAENRPSDQAQQPVDDKTKATIKDQLKQQKVNQKYSQWIQDQLKSSRVVKS